MMIIWRKREKKNDTFLGRSSKASSWMLPLILHPPSCFSLGLVQIFRHCCNVRIVYSLFFIHCKTTMTKVIRPCFFFFYLFSFTIIDTFYSPRIAKTYLCMCVCWWRKTSAIGGLPCLQLLYFVLEEGVLSGWRAAVLVVARGERRRDAFECQCLCSSSSLFVLYFFFFCLVSFFYIFWHKKIVL